MLKDSQQRKATVSISASSAPVIAYVMPFKRKGQRCLASHGQVYLQREAWTQWLPGGRRVA